MGENNQNPDIIEWEEYDVDDLKSDDYALYPYEEQCVQLTPEQKEFAQQIGEALDQDKGIWYNKSC